MNLWPKDTSPAGTDDGGVLELSEFTGAAVEADERAAGQPHDTNGVKSAIARAWKCRGTRAASG
jgi:trehalose 6-phosphate synthase